MTRSSIAMIMLRINQLQNSIVIENKEGKKIGGIP